MGSMLANFHMCGIMLVLRACCCLPTPMTLASGGVLSSRLWSTSQLSIWPVVSVNKSRGDNVVQLKRCCVSCVWVLQRGHSGDGCVLASTLCKYDLFVLRRGSISSELPMCGGGVRSILLLPLVARCLETIDVCIWCMFVFMSVVVTVWGSVGMFVVYRPLLKIVGFWALECWSMLCVENHDINTIN